VDVTKGRQDILLPPPPLFSSISPWLLHCVFILSVKSFNQGLYFCHWRVLKRKIITDQKANKKDFQESPFPCVTAEVTE